MEKVERTLTGVDVQLMVWHNIIIGSSFSVTNNVAVLIIQLYCQRTGK